jgi:hypothetical protein
MTSSEYSKWFGVVIILLAVLSGVVWLPLGAGWIWAGVMAGATVWGSYYLLSNEHAAGR